MSERRQIQLDKSTVDDGADLFRAREAAAQSYDDWIKERLDAYAIDPEACGELTYNPWTGRLVAVLKSPPEKPDAEPGTRPADQ